MSKYSIWVLEYAQLDQYARGALQYGAYEGSVRLPFCYVLIKSDEHISMVDVGYNHADYGGVLGKKFGISNWHSPRDVLEPFGLTPSQINTIFLTHAHFDHMGNLQDFPNAHFYIQQREISEWIRAMTLPEEFKALNGATDPGDILNAVRAACEGRLHYLDGDASDVIPGIDVHAAFDTHTYGSMWIHVRNDLSQESQDGWILAGDLVYVYENLGCEHPDQVETGPYVPVGLATGSQTRLIETSATMVRTTNGERRRVIPIHDRRLPDVFPSRKLQNGLTITEICRADGQESMVR
ncbi:N-acyl homoserine lactonase family protein [Paraburkholderia sp. BL25I1N1]|uniref:N-acyl homoserine lactonase family protein n=1 Tax=Paraburkholderia sp. BL25I1N1 TaxID=1938804 RepID=UPI000D04E51E|nr:N-acyl homoserine lactonase family protein [Paraburkholderia sp. BL25I1N1]PRX96454.1 glyoxylase-like metal-dependent hydrolase (beta-lactamase superfamily II) [Paraburkholderia sp. BL25I1N1]